VQPKSKRRTGNRSPKRARSKTASFRQAVYEAVLIQEYRSLKTEDRKIVDERGLKRCLWLLIDAWEEIEDVANKLKKIDEFRDQEVDRQATEYENLTGERIDFGPPEDLISVIHAVYAVMKYLNKKGIFSTALEKLDLALLWTCGGTPPAMLRGPPLSHRPSKPSKILEIKGILAAAMHEYQRRHKLSRSEAARAVLKNISPDLKGHLAKTQITVRMILNWRDKFGAVSAEAGLGKNSYLRFKKSFQENPDSHDEWLQGLTAGYARILPSL
jgi:hypothetical protein